MRKNSKRLSAIAERKANASLIAECSQPVSLAPRRQGAPSLYTPDLAEEICRRLRCGQSLKSICSDERMPNQDTVLQWVIEDREGFAGSYTRARESACDLIAEEILEIIDAKDGDPVRDRLRFDGRRWYLAKFAPRRFGDRVQVDQTGPGTRTVIVGMDGLLNLYRRALATSDVVDVTAEAGEQTYPPHPPSLDRSERED